MNTLIILVVSIALLGSALVGGVFFAFSNFVMKALARIRCADGIAAMQSINVVVINRWFLGVFAGSALCAVVVTILALFNPGHPSLIYLIGGAVFYFFGTFAVTLLGNVPLNEQLAGLSASNPDAAGFWRHYLRRWTTWNHIRTGAAMIAVLFYIVGLTQIAAV